MQCAISIKNTINYKVAQKIPALTGLKLCFSLTTRLCALVFCLNNRVFQSRNYRLIVAARKFDVLKTNVCPRSEASRPHMLLLRTSNFQGETIRPIVPRHKRTIVFIVHHEIFFRAPVRKSYLIIFNFFR